MKNKKKVILVSGRMQSGKNQFAEYLDQAYQLDKVKVRQDLFAKPVKDWSREDFHALVTYLNGKTNLIINMLKSHQMYLKERYPAHEKFVSDPIDDIIYITKKLKIEDENFYENKTELTRIILQMYGTNIFRDRVDYDFWVKQLIKRVKESDEDVTIVTDVRFPNEIDLLLDDEDLDVISIRVERNMERMGKENKHESETALDDYRMFNYIVDNNGTLEDLWNSMCCMFFRWLFWWQDDVRLLP